MSYFSLALSGSPLKNYFPFSFSQNPASFFLLQMEKVPAKAEEVEKVSEEQMRSGEELEERSKSNDFSTLYYV